MQASGDAQSPVSSRTWVMPVPVLLDMIVVDRDDRPPQKAAWEVSMQVVVRIKGHLDPIWQEWLEGLQIAQEPDGTTRLSGSLKVQLALLGSSLRPEM
jgi:hypothetical protein